eukprot:scpid64828/ scgid25269/ 
MVGLGECSESSFLGNPFKRGYSAHFAQRGIIAHSDQTGEDGATSTRTLDAPNLECETCKKAGKDGAFVVRCKVLRFLGAVAWTQYNRGGKGGVFHFINGSTSASDTWIQFTYRGKSLTCTKSRPVKRFGEFNLDTIKVRVDCIPKSSNRTSGADELTIVAHNKWGTRVENVSPESAPRC